MGAVVSIGQIPTTSTECAACSAMREALRMCLGALVRYYAEELERNDPDELSVSELVQGGVVLRAERALRMECTCALAPPDRTASASPRTPGKTSRSPEV